MRIDAQYIPLMSVAGTVVAGALVEWVKGRMAAPKTTRDERREEREHMEKSLEKSEAGEAEWREKFFNLQLKYIEALAENKQVHIDMDDILRGGFMKNAKPKGEGK